MQTTAVRGESGEVFLPFKTPRERIHDAKYFRSTWLSSSLTSLRNHGEYDRYLGLLEPEHRHTIDSLVVGHWLPTEVAIAHYRACGALGMSKSAIVERSREVTRRVHVTALSTVVRMVREVGVTPWTVLAQIDRVWERVWQGGGIAVRKLGPKEAVIDVVGWRCAEVPYCRVAMPAVASAVLELFCNRAFVSDVTRGELTSAISLKCAWA